MGLRKKAEYLLGGLRTKASIIRDYEKDNDSIKKNIIRKYQEYFDQFLKEISNKIPSKNNVDNIMNKIKKLNNEIFNNKS